MEQAMVSTSRKRSKTNLNAGLERDLLLYTTAAGAACAGLFACAIPAQGEIVYTATNTVIPARHKLAIDLNHDGITDFTVSNYKFCTDICGRTLRALASGSNAIAGVPKFLGLQYAAALKAGSKIGSTIEFQGKLMAASGSEYGTIGSWLGGLTNRYLGIKFMIKDEVHYGWARLSVKSGAGKIGAVLTGYAYETVANRPIVAGRMKGSEVTSRLDSSPGTPAAAATLGMLASGAPTLAAWRREEKLG
jgi:hypothetical protein